jgi:predicted ATPase
MDGILQEFLDCAVIIWLSGPTGAGKTSLARSLRKSGYSIVEEKIPRICSERSPLTRFRIATLYNAI